MESSRDARKKDILKVVNNQIRNLDPPATKETFDRLVAEGFGEDEARRLIGLVVASESSRFSNTNNLTTGTGM